MCGSVAWAVGSGLALASPLCKDALIKDSATTKDAVRGYNSQVKCRVIFPDNAEYGLTVDSAAGALATIAALMYCDANMGQVLSGVAGGLVASTAVQYAYSS